MILDKNGEAINKYLKFEQIIYTIYTIIYNIPKIKHFS